jgi:hypothetical protein
MTFAEPRGQDRPYSMNITSEGFGPPRDVKRVAGCYAIEGQACRALVVGTRNFSSAASPTGEPLQTSARNYKNTQTDAHRCKRAEYGGAVARHVAPLVLDRLLIWAVCRFRKLDGAPAPNIDHDWSVASNREPSMISKRTSLRMNAVVMYRVADARTPMGTVDNVRQAL